MVRLPTGGYSLGMSLTPSEEQERLAELQQEIDEEREHLREQAGEKEDEDPVFIQRGEEGGPADDTVAPG